MLQKLVSSALKTQPKISTGILYVCIHGVPKTEFKTSFSHWILKYFKTNTKYVTHTTTYNAEYPKSKNEIKFELGSKNKISCLKTDELLNYMMIISEDFTVTKNIMQNVDNEVCKRLRTANITNQYTSVLKITDTLIYFTHSHVQLMKSYILCVENIKNIIRRNEIELEHLVQCAFYISMLKDKSLARSAMKLILAKVHLHVAIIDMLSPVDLCVFYNSIYKSSTKILSKKTLAAIVSSIYKNLDELLKNEELLIGSIKPLFQAKYHDYNFLEKLSNEIINNQNFDINKYSFKTVVHLIKLFANSLYNDENFIRYLADYSVVKLERMYKNKEYIRAKDISILLKAFSELGFDSLKNLTTATILPILIDAFDNFEIKDYERKSFADIILWLTVLQVRDESFLDKVIDSKLIIRGKKDGSGQSICKMNLLLTILSIEKLIPSDKINKLMDLVEPTEGHSLEQLYKSQPALYHVNEAARCLASTKQIVEQPILEFQIPTLFIPGITVQCGR